MQKLHFFIILPILLCGCQRVENYHVDDPLESINRPIESTNSTLDAFFFTPISKFYQGAVPNQLRYGIHRMFLNLGEISNSVNAALQADWPGVENSVGRFAINSTFGLFGFFDKAQEIGMKRTHYDFGQTLYKWGYKDSTFVMVPLLGPATIRDSFGIIVDGILLNPTMYVSPQSDQNLLVFTQFIDLKTNIHERYSTIKPPEYFDRYVVYKDAYLQNREYFLNPPEWDELYELDY